VNHGNLEVIELEGKEKERSSCNFCTRRDPAKLKLSSTSDMRGLRVTVCDHCTNALREYFLNEIHSI